MMRRNLMKALHFDGKELQEVEKPVPQPADDEVLIRVHYAGICNTDLEILKGYMDFRGTPGHEFVGTVVQSPDARLTGRRVVGEINLACGRCEYCRQGLGRHCPHRTVLGIAGKDGAFAEYLTLPIANVHVVPDSVSELQAVFTEPLAAACEILEQLHILPEYRVLVLGDGKLAQLIARVLHLYTDKLWVVGKHPQKLALLEEQGIATLTLEQVRQKTDRYHVVVEATGSFSGWELALQKVRPRGFLVLKSTLAGEQSLNLAPVVIDEITVVGSRCGPFPMALHLLERHRVQTDDLISAVVPFAQWRRAFDLARESESLKVILDMKGGLPNGSLRNRG